MGKPIGKTSAGETLYPYNAGMKGLKGSAEEGGVRVPFFVRWSGKVEPNRDIHTVAAHIDLFPTLLDLAGADQPANQVEGRSLVPLISNSESEWKDRLLFTHKGRWKRVSIRTSISGKTLPSVMGVIDWLVVISCLTCN